MGIRIQPREIDVPPADPFKNDLLGRKEPVAGLIEEQHCRKCVRYSRLINGGAKYGI